MKRVSLAVLLAVPGLSLAQGKEKKVPATKHLCAAGEEVLFSCELTGKGAKVASLCASKDLSEAQGSLAYRFGKPGKVELEFPGKGSRARPQELFTYARYTRPEATYLGVKFVNGGYTYELLYTYSDEGNPKAQPESTVVVTPPQGGKGTKLVCRNPVAGSLMALEERGFESAEFWR